jgi:O-succinylbenzoate synthase
MLIRAVTLTHVRVPLVEPFRISSGAVAEKDGIVVRLDTDEGAGYGESSPMAGSFYSADTPESCWRELLGEIVPRIAGSKWDSPLDAAECVMELPGSNFARVGIETALWDVEARRQGVPLFELLGGAGNPVPSGLAVGLYDSVTDLLNTIERYLRDGYRRVKIKIERGRDIELVEAVRQHFGNIPLFVDANGAYDMSDLDTFRALDDYGLMMIEQPFPGPMLRELGALQREIRTPVCLDESLESEADLRQAIDLGSLRIANIKIQRVGGFHRALRMYDICRQHMMPVWVGTMPELGIGQAQGMAFATLKDCTYPTDVEASLRWFQDDIIDPFLEVNEGCLQPSRSPGLGFAVSETKLRKYCVASERFGS